MTIPENNSIPQSTPFEDKYQLTPLGEDYEARTLRAEAIAGILLPEIMDARPSSTIGLSTLAISHSKLVATQKLDEFRDPNIVEERNRWELAEIDATLASE